MNARYLSTAIGLSLFSFFATFIALQPPAFLDTSGTVPSVPVPSQLADEYGCWTSGDHDYPSGVIADFGFGPEHSDVPHQVDLALNVALGKVKDSSIQVYAFCPR